MKKLLVVIALLASAGAAHAEYEPFHFGVGMCSYSWSERTDSVMWDVKGGASMPRQVYQRQVDYCTSSENLSRAVQAHVKFAAQPQPERIERELPAADYEGAVRTYKRCVAVVGNPRLCGNYVMGY